MKKILLTILLLIVIVPSIGVGIKSNFWDYKLQYIVSIHPQNIDCDASFESINIEDMIKYSLNYTKSHLDFKLKSSNNMNANKLNQTKIANCVGYTTYYNAVLNKILKQNNMIGYTIVHARVSIIFLGRDVCTVFKDKSFKNHDISIITNNLNDNKYYVDASLSEAFGDIILKK